MSQCTWFFSLTAGKRLKGRDVEFVIAAAWVGDLFRETEQWNTDKAKPLHPPLPVPGTVPVLPCLV